MNEAHRQDLANDLRALRNFADDLGLPLTTVLPALRFMTARSHTGLNQLSRRFALSRHQVHRLGGFAWGSDWVVYHHAPKAYCSLPLAFRRVLELIALAEAQA